MNKCIWALVLAVSCQLGVANSALAQNLSAFSQRFEQAQFLQDNAMALKFRLALLDQAGAGTKVRIASFVFDYGQAVETLSAHMCQAAKRGASVQLIVDAKAGGLAGIDNPYNSDPLVKKSEELFQYLSRCGVNVVIHNYGTQFVSVLGTRIPNLFGAAPGSSLNPLTLLNQLTDLRNRLADLVQPTLAKYGVQSGFGGVLSHVQDLVMALRQLLSHAGTVAENQDAGGYDPSQADITQVASTYRALLNDPLWSELDPAKMTALSDAVEQALNTDPQLSVAHKALREFNRLNHRKLFLVQNENENCAIIGGRNLGDHYLTNQADSYHDGDVFFCAKNDPAKLKFFARANEDLDELTQPSDDPAQLDSKSVPQVVKADARIQFSNLDVRRIRPMNLDLNSLKGQPLPGLSTPVLLTSNWHPAEDGVRMALLRAIDQEQKEIYIETAYAEFNGGLRRALEGALARGVKVHVVTNGLFISDGNSQLIRLWMARWTDVMQAKYGRKLFQFDYAPLSAGHMIHFKGAGFRCQKDVLGGYYRTYIVGSHNFHPRSGYSDKENSVLWREPTDATCPTPQSDLITLRRDYYKSQGDGALVYYSRLYDEANEVALSADQKSATLAKAILQSLYDGGPDGDLYEADQLEKVETLLDLGKMRDLVGRLL